ncbi:MAG TPA: glycosyltransferase family 4 protein [Terriglobales bacterium]|nr:glycosyltransferase family 4 protein [Terriglobales bacterium]
MKTKEPTQPITIFTPSFADEDDTNAQNLTVKEIVARLPPELFRVIMISEGNPDPRITARKNTKLLPYYKHGNMAQLLIRCVASSPDVYFYPRQGPLDQVLFVLRKKLRLRMAVVSHIVMVMNDVTGNGLVARSIVEGDAVVANSAYVAETVRQRFGVRAGTIYNGIDRRFFFPSDEPPSTHPAGPLTVLYAGSFQPRKRVEFVIQQAARWPNVMFRLVGRGETETACRALAAELKCRNVDFLGHRPPAELGEEMRRAHVFLFPSILEGHPQVLGQAAACGLPVVAMNVYRPEYVLQGQTGFLAESDAELTQKLDVLLRDSAMRQSMASAAARHSQKFDWDQIAKQWIKVFRDVVAERQNS